MASRLRRRTPVDHGRLRDERAEPPPWSRTNFVFSPHDRRRSRRRRDRRVPARSAHNVDPRARRRPPIPGSDGRLRQTACLKFSKAGTFGFVSAQNHGFKGTDRRQLEVEAGRHRQRGLRLRGVLRVAIGASATSACTGRWCPVRSSTDVPASANCASKRELEDRELELGADEEPVAIDCSADP